jgi:NADP-reducing hydrogenase subunit HndB
MPKLDRQGLEHLRSELKSKTALGAPGRRVRLTVHLGTCGLASGAGKVLAAAKSALEDRGADDVVLTASGCAGLCCREPMATVEIAGEEPVKYADLDEKAIGEIVEKHVMAGKIVEQYVLGVGGERTA